MVFLPNCSGLQVQVLCSGRTLQEYRNANEQDQDNSLTRYIKAESGVHYGINFKMTYDHHFDHGGVLATLHIDGIFMQQQVMRAQDVLGGTTWRCYMSGSTAYVDGTHMERPFHFGQLLEESDLRNEDTDTSIEKAGSILVRFYEVTNFRPAPHAEHDFLTLSDHDTLPKKVLKGASLSHLTSLDSARLAPQHNNREMAYCDFVDGEQSRPFAEVRFKYRSLDVLKTLDLQPRTGLGKRLMKAENDAANIIKKEEDIEDHDQLHFQAKKEPVDENLQTGAKTAEDDLRIKRELIEEDVYIKEEPADEHMHAKAERAEDDVRVKEEPLEEDAHI